MYLHRIYEHKATATSPGLITHNEWKIDTFFHDLSTAIAEEMKLALWVGDYESPGRLAQWLKLVMASPVYQTTTLPLVIEFPDGASPHTITYRLDHYPLEGKRVERTPPVSAH